LNEEIKIFKVEEKGNRFVGKVTTMKGYFEEPVFDVPVQIKFELHKLLTEVSIIRINEGHELAVLIIDLTAF